MLLMKLRMFLVEQADDDKDGIVISYCTMCIAVCLCVSVVTARNFKVFLLEPITFGI